MDKVKVSPIANDVNNPPQNAQPKKKKTKKKKKRCSKCNKKLGLIPFDCKCGNIFCSKCRYPEEHNCTYDFRASAKEKLEKANPIIKFNKVIPI